jgi:hypothetical protein
MKYKLAETKEMKHILAGNFDEHVTFAVMGSDRPRGQGPAHQ